MSKQKKNLTPVKAHVIGGRHDAAFYNPYKPRRRVENADTSTQLSSSEDRTAGEWILCEVDRLGLENLVDSSTILPQCISAWARNIAGYGIGMRYRDDKMKELPEAQDEMARATQILDSLSLDMDTKTVFEHIIEARETYGASYLEVIRDMEGNVCRIDFIEDTPTITRSVRDEFYTDTEAWLNGQPIAHRKRFCRYKQEIGGRVIYYKEFGDPRRLDNRTGRYAEEADPLPPEYQANEILEFAIGPRPYGQIRWRGNILGIAGAAKAEFLNYNYFINGRHTPLLIFIRGGMLKEESEQELEHYMANIKGEDGQHAFIVLCAEPEADSAYGVPAEQPQIELKDLSPMLQKDALFLEYMEAKRKQVQSAFLLPDLYVGYTTEFNRATAQTAKQTTEEQAFKSERAALSWMINNKLLASYGFRYVEAYFMEPDLTNPDDLYKLMNVCNAAGGLTPNKAKEILYEQLGDQPEPYMAEWGDTPLQVTQSSRQQQENPFGMQGGQGGDFELLAPQLTAQIQNAEQAGVNEEVVEIMRSVRNMLREMQDEEAES